MKKGFHRGESDGPLFGADSLGPWLGGTYEGGGPGATIVLRGGKVGGPAGGVKDEGADASAEGCVGICGGSANVFLGIEPSTLAGATPGC